ncbi:mid-cell-anchored protein Z [Enterococcus sp. AZ191]|uniref:cell division site-positioning protein MapZ family protein n=1 Tax=Enterococcus sp. AZ191 TaxID=2774639 RepID=UPI003F1FDFB8
MIKKCPKCGSDKIEDKSTCPDCGYQIEEIDQHTNEENESISQSHEGSSEEVFPDSELNDPIEWSELKDLPLESVMEIFKNDVTPKENTMSQTATNMKDKEEKQPLTIDKKLVKEEQTKNQPKDQSLEKTIDNEQKKRVAELKEFVDQEEENSILAAYIKAHREDTTEEHAKELMKMINDKIAAKEGQSSDQMQEVTDASVSEKAEVSKPLEAKARLEEDVSPIIESIKEEEKAEKEENSEPAEPIKTNKPLSDLEKEIDTPIAASIKTSEDATDTKENEIQQPTPETVIPETEPQKEEIPLPEENEDNKKAAKTKKSRKIPYIVLAVAVLIGAGGWAYYDHQQTVQAQIAAEAKKQQQKVNELKKTLATFYYDGAHQFLRTSMINQDLTKLKTALNEVKGEKGYADLEKTYEDIQTKVKDIKGVNELFTTEAIIDDHLADDLKLKADQEIQRFATDDSDFGQLLKKAQDEAEAQYDQLQTAKEKTNIVFADDKVADSATREQYTDAQKTVDQVKNQELAVTLKDQLKQVDDILTKKEEQQKKEEEAKKAEESKKAAEAAEAARKAQAVAQAAQQAANSSSVNKNSANQPIMATRPSDVADTANAAWNWAPGVQESVINTCIQRGYIVQGGYRLEKVRIENGQGYYNLYATSTKSSLMNGIGESALPFYIVTINCKTGWFGGNGSR